MNVVGREGGKHIFDVILHQYLHIASRSAVVFPNSHALFRAFWLAAEPTFQILHQAVVSLNLRPCGWHVFLNYQCATGGYIVFRLSFCSPTHTNHHKASL